VADAPRVLLASPFIPPEFVAAHGCRPLRRTDQAAPACHAGRCAAATGFDAGLGGVELAVTVTSCDQLRRSGEQAAGALFRFDLPATTGALSARLYRDELRRLGRFLVRHGGRAPDPARLAAEAADHDRRRARLRTACALLPARAAAEALADYAESGAVPAADPTPAAADGRLPIALLGGPLARAAFAFYDLVESCGARVALDGSEGGERGLPAPFDRRRLGEDPLGELVDAYFGAMPDAFRRPDELLHRWLDRGLAERGIRAVVVRLDPWCDLWRGQIPRLRDWGRLPVLALEAGEEPGAAARTATRIEALVEMVRCC
jgi:hypothetical protein